MLELLLPFRDLGTLYPHNFVPPFLTKERLKLCWEQVVQLRGLLPQAYCQPHKLDRHPYDSHPMQLGVALFHFAFKMTLQYEEPNPTSRLLAARMIERLAEHIAAWVDGQGVALSSAASSLVAQHGSARSHRLAYAPGQRLCYASGEAWREAAVLRPPTGT
eukprot:4442279-Prymnesium_polylepis.1